MVTNNAGLDVTVTTITASTRAYTRRRGYLANHWRQLGCQRAY